MNCLDKTILLNAIKRRFCLVAWQVVQNVVKVLCEKHTGVASLVIQYYFEDFEKFLMVLNWHCLTNV